MCFQLQVTFLFILSPVLLPARVAYLSMPYCRNLSYKEPYGTTMFPKSTLTTMVLFEVLFEDISEQPSIKVAALLRLVTFKC